MQDQDWGNQVGRKEHCAGNTGQRLGAFLSLGGLPTLLLKLPMPMPACLEYATCILPGREKRGMPGAVFGGWVWWAHAY